MTLKELRMYHWDQVMSKRATANRTEARITDHCGSHNRSYFKRTAAAAHKVANFHLGAVQALNDFVEGTAEHDCNVRDGLC